MKPHEVEPLPLIKTCLTNLERLCGNGKGHSVKERQNEDKVQQKGHERRQQAGGGGEGGVITERERGSVLKRS